MKKIIISKVGPYVAEYEDALVDLFMATGPKSDVVRDAKAHAVELAKLGTDVIVEMRDAQGRMRTQWPFYADDYRSSGVLTVGADNLDDRGK